MKSKAVLVGTEGKISMEIDFSAVTGIIKPMHAVNNAPIDDEVTTYFNYVREGGFPFSRLHDTGGKYGGNRYVDIHNIFRDFSADPDCPDSYDFAFTDILIEGLVKNGAEPFFRLGETIENQHYIKTYRIIPPKDFQKWAKICEKIILHYNEGWADGFHFGIRYWEIWNEPDNYNTVEENHMWKGTFEEYMELYRVTSVYLKEKFPNLKIGGYASCGFYNIVENSFNAEANSTSRLEYFIECFHKFMKFARDNSLPLDFFSWHSYSDSENNIEFAEYVRSQLDEYGYGNTESILNEWNPGIKLRGTLEDAANISEMMLKLQNTSLDMLMYYDGQIDGLYQGLFNPITYRPFKAFYVFKAFDVLYRLQEQVRVTGQEDGIACVAAKNQENIAILLTNKGERCFINIAVLGVCVSEFQITRLNEKKDLELCECRDDLKNIVIGKFETMLIKGRIKGTM